MSSARARTRAGSEREEESTPEVVGGSHGSEVVRLIERFAPDPQVRHVSEKLVHAPPELALEVAENFDLLSIPMVFAIFWLRARILGATPPQRDDLAGLVAATQRMGWRELARRPGRELVMGAAVQPWLSEPVFEPVPPERFVTHAEPERVKIVWTLEAEPVGRGHSRFRTETRVVPTDEAARKKFRRYWLSFGAGIGLIRFLALPAMRRKAERRWRAETARGRAFARRPSEHGGRRGRRGRWGATGRTSREERLRPLPGDALVSCPMASWTHAVTIDAPPEQVWPWLAQLGAGRAGWYSYDFLDNGGDPSATAILPRFQAVRPGDVLPAVPGATDAFVAEEVDPPRTLILTGPRDGDGPIVSWAFVLEPLGDGRVRLLARARAAHAWRDLARNAGSPGHLTLIDRIYRALARLPSPLLRTVGGFGHGIMQRKMLGGIKRRAEGRAAASR